MTNIDNTNTNTNPNANTNVNTNPSLVNPAHPNQQELTGNFQPNVGNQPNNAEAQIQHVPTEYDQYRDKLRCSFCLNLLTQSTNINIIELSDILPSENMAKQNGRAIAVLCDDCYKANRKPKFAFAIRKSGVEGEDTITSIDLNTLSNEPIQEPMPSTSTTTLQLQSQQQQQQRNINSQNQNQ